MKIALSRKGFDSKMGGCASPILEDGRIVSLPIPDEAGQVTYGEIRMQDIRLGGLVGDLTGGRVTAASSAHFDPDLRRETLPRGRGWRPLFGQSGSAQRHLENHGIGRGDLFLFYGWFRRVEHIQGHYRFVPDAPDLHVIFGWLTVGEIWRLGGPGFASPKWARQHPHISRPPKALDTVYVGSDATSGLGSGVSSRLRSELVLTALGRTRSWWRLPAGLLPRDGRPALSYHGDPNRWRRCGDHVTLRTVGRGQEFVLDAGQCPKAAAWAEGLIRGL